MADLVDGSNVTVLAYGQTSSGKSYTMYGSAAEPGLVASILLNLMRRLEDKVTLYR